MGEQKEIAKEVDELRAAQQWINQEGWDVASEVHVTSRSNPKETIDLRLDWAAVKQMLERGKEDVFETDSGQVDEVTVLADFSLDKLDPTQRAFADRVLKWGNEVADVCKALERDGRISLERPSLSRDSIGDAFGQRSPLI